MDTEATQQHCRLQQPVLYRWINAIIRKTDKAPRSLNLYTRWRLVFSFTPRPTLPTTEFHCIYTMWHWRTLGHKLSLLVWTKEEWQARADMWRWRHRSCHSQHLYWSPLHLDRFIQGTYTPRKSSVSQEPVRTFPRTQESFCPAGHSRTNGYPTARPSYKLSCLDWGVAVSSSRTLLTLVKLINVQSCINLLTPNVNYSGRTAPLTSKVAFYIFIQQIYVLNILNMV